MLLTVATYSIPFLSPHHTLAEIAALLKNDVEWCLELIFLVVLS